MLHPVQMIVEHLKDRPRVVGYMTTIPGRCKCNIDQYFDFEDKNELGLTVFRGWRPSRRS